jgi:hypothetical protein
MASPYDTFKNKKIDMESTLRIDLIDFVIIVKHGGSSNRPFVNAMQQVNKSFASRDQMADAGKLSDEAIEKLTEQKAKAIAKIYFDHVIVGWENVTDEEGKKLAFNETNVVKVLTDLPVLFDVIVQESLKQGHFKEAQEEEEVKNSEKS